MTDDKIDGCVVHMVHKWNSYRLLTGNPKGKRPHV